jgi:hypothetical protein
MIGIEFSSCIHFTFQVHISSQALSDRGSLSDEAIATLTNRVDVIPTAARFAGVAIPDVWEPKPTVYAVLPINLTQVYLFGVIME